MAQSAQVAAPSQVISDQAARAILIPMYVVLAYGAFVLSGFSTLPFTAGPPANYARALPLFIFFSLLLLTLEGVTVQNAVRSFTFYLLPVTLFALVFGADDTFFGGRQQFVHNPLTYLILNTLTLPAFVVSIGIRRQQKRSSGPSGAAGAVPATPYTTLASYTSGLSFLGFINRGLLGLASSTVGINAEPAGWRLPTITQLGNVDLYVGLGAAFVALALLVIAGLLIGTGGAQGALTFWQALQRVFGSAVAEGGYSLKYVLSPIVAFAPGVSIAVFSRQITQTLVAGSHITTTQTSPWAVLNPFSQTAVHDYATALLTLLYGVVAVLTTIGAVAVLEIDRDRSILPDTVRTILEAGRAVGLVLGLFLLSLGVLNVLLLVTNAVHTRPFQLGAISVVGLGTAVVLIAYAQARAQTKPSS
jgi:hypothetical protein